MLLRFKPIIFSLLIGSLLISCEKEMSEENGGIPNPGGGTGGGGGGTSAALCKSCAYIPFCNGTTYNYIDSSMGTATPAPATITIIKDTTIDGKVFQKFGNPGADGYYNCTNGVSTLVAFQVPSSAGPVVRITSTLLKANEPVGATWTDVVTNGIGQDVTYTSSIVSKGISRTILGNTYPDVIHVHVEMTIEVPVLGTFPAGSSDYYYAKNVGLIDMMSYDPTLGMLMYRHVLQSYNIP